MRIKNSASKEEFQPLTAHDTDEDDSLHFCIGDDSNSAGDARVDDHNRVEVQYDLHSDASGDVTRPRPKGGPVEQWESDLQSERRVVGGAAAAGAIAGLVLAGPIVAIAVAGGAAAVATTRGKAGEVTRATGEVMAQAGDRLQNLDKKHKISEKAANAFSKNARWLTERLKTKHERENDAVIGLTS